MNSRIKDAIARKTDPEGYGYQKLLRELELQRAQTFREFLTMSPVKQYAQEAVAEAVAEYEARMEGKMAQIIDEMDVSEESFKADLDRMVKDSIKDTQAQLEALARSAQEQQSLIATTLSAITERFTELAGATKIQLEQFFSDAERFRGKTGDKGERGERGEKGETGESVEKESILAELKPELDRLRAEVKRLAQQKGGGGGGGMGNIQHESKAVSSATTSVNTTYTIGGNGFAIWAYYQGQLIMRGEHYTVSGKTISLLFTPEDNTNLDVIYIR